MSGNLCRCGAYAGITEAVLEARQSIAELQPEALRMNQFEYIRPATVSDAVAAAAEAGAAYLASGTNLLDLMKGGIARPNRLVDITRLPGLDRIEQLADGGSFPVILSRLERSAATKLESTDGRSRNNRLGAAHPRAH